VALGGTEHDTYCFRARQMITYPRGRADSIGLKGEQRAAQLLKRAGLAASPEHDFWQLEVSEAVAAEQLEVIGHSARPASLMIEHWVGVSHSVAKIPKPDSYHCLVSAFSTNTPDVRGGDVT